MMKHRQMQARDGQAMIEFLIGIVAVLVLVAGMLQIVSIGRARSDAMINARRDAGARALTPLNALDNAEYIANWYDGQDDSRYSADDFHTPAQPGPFQERFIDPAGDGAAGWGLINAIPNNQLSALRAAPDPADRFGLVVGSDQDSIELLPAVRHLLYDDESIDVEVDVWLSTTRGIY